MAGKLPVFFIDPSPPTTRRSDMKNRRRSGRWVPLRIQRNGRRGRVNDSTRSPWPAVGIVIVGLGLAWCFQRVETSPGSGGRVVLDRGEERHKPSEPLMLRVPAGAPPSCADAQPVGPATLSRFHSEQESGLPVRTDLSQPASAETPPPMERQYGKLLKQLVPLSIPPKGPTEDKPTQTLQTPENSVLPGAAGEDEMATLPAKPSHGSGTSAKISGASHGSHRTHVIRDRDTLSSIAERYYGSADFAGRIFAANRNILSQPDLLPVGKALVLPDPQMPVGSAPLVPLAPGTQQAAGPPAQADSDSKNPVPSTKLVPLSVDP